MLRQRKQRSAAEASAVICKLKGNLHFQQAHILLLYSALPDEVPTQELLDELVAEGKTVLLPRVVNDTEMELRRYTGAKDLQIGAFGILEPTGERFTDYETIEVAVVPGMAFDIQGHRLGRGKGYYDRFLTKIPHAYKIGICYPSRLLDLVPTDDNDVLMDEVIS
jgi:5,10-methenyltetrahydrofolate synthetase